jgi:hypothetical protein
MQFRPVSTGSDPQPNSYCMNGDRSLARPLQNWEQARHYCKEPVILKRRTSAPDGEQTASAWRERITSIPKHETTGLLADEQVPAFGEDFKLDTSPKDCKHLCFSPHTRSKKNRATSKSKDSSKLR